MKSIGTKSCRIIGLCAIALAIVPFAGMLHAQGAVGDGLAAGETSSALPGIFRTERTPVRGGSEIITIFARKDGPDGDLPLVSVLRDTLGDGRVENDRLRYVWLHSYTKPSFRQKLASFVPFLYTRTSNKGSVGNKPPPPVADLNRPAGSGGWDTLFWHLFRGVLLGNTGRVVKAPGLQYRENKEDYRRAAIATTLAVLSIYEQASRERVLTNQELQDIQARLVLIDKVFGAHMQSENLSRVYEKRIATDRDERAQNWEMMRQLCERQGLVFDPLRGPDGNARHALVWIAEEDLSAARDRKWVGRFLNIKNPWKDSDLKKWQGYKQVRWYDADDREVAEGTDGATKRTLIPLALYGLSNPSIPAILIDFRHAANPKLRETSHRIMGDIVSDFFGLTQPGGLAVFAGKFGFDLLIHKRGIDIDQRSRMRSYAELKLLLELNDSFDPELRSELENRVETVSLNPLANDTAVEERLARTQYRNLMAWADDENGLTARIADDRREEMMRVKHPALPVRVGFSLAHYLSFGTYTHRERETPELLAKLDNRRQLDYHERVVREIAMRTNDPSIDSNVDKLKSSLEFLSSNGREAGGKTARSLAMIFTRSHDDELRSLCIAGLYKINSEGAKRELIAIYQNQQLPTQFRNASAHYLKLAAEEGQRMFKVDVRTVAGIPSTN